MVGSIVLLKLRKLPATRPDFKNYMKQNLKAKWNQTQIMEIINEHERDSRPSFLLSYLKKKYMNFEA